MVRVILQGRQALINLLSCKDRDQRLLSWDLVLIRPNKEVDTSLGNLSVILSRRRPSLAHLLRKTQRTMACILMKRLEKFLVEIKSGKRNRDKWERLSINSVASPQKQWWIKRQGRRLWDRHMTMRLLGATTNQCRSKKASQEIPWSAPRNQKIWAVVSQ